MTPEAGDSEGQDQTEVRVFVYGTLQPGECNFEPYCADRIIQIQPAIAYGQLFALPFGYPAMTEGNAPVYGYLLSFLNPTILMALDELEDFDPQRPADGNEYNRVAQEVFDRQGRSLGQAWLYRMERDLVDRVGGVLLEGGKFRGDRE